MFTRALGKFANKFKSSGYISSAAEPAGSENAQKSHGAKRSPYGSSSSSIPTSSGLSTPLDPTFTTTKKDGRPAVEEATQHNHDGIGQDESTADEGAAPPVLDACVGGGVEDNTTQKDMNLVEQVTNAAAESEDLPQPPIEPLHSRIEKYTSATTTSKTSQQPLLDNPPRPGKSSTLASVIAQFERPYLSKEAETLPAEPRTSTSTSSSTMSSSSSSARDAEMQKILQVASYALKHTGETDATTTPSTKAKPLATAIARWQMGCPVPIESDDESSAAPDSPCVRLGGEDPLSGDLKSATMSYGTDALTSLAEKPSEAADNAKLLVPLPHCTTSTQQQYVLPALFVESAGSTPAAEILETETAGSVDDVAVLDEVDSGREERVGPVQSQKADFSEVLTSRIRRIKERFAIARHNNNTTPHSEAIHAALTTATNPLNTLDEIITTLNTHINLVLAEPAVDHGVVKNVAMLLSDMIAGGVFDIPEWEAVVVEHFGCIIGEDKAKRIVEPVCKQYLAMYQPRQVDACDVPDGDTEEQKGLRPLIGPKVLAAHRKLQQAYQEDLRNKRTDDTNTCLSLHDDSSHASNDDITAVTSADQTNTQLTPPVIRAISTPSLDDASQANIAAVGSAKSEKRRSLSNEEVHDWLGLGGKGDATSPFLNFNTTTPRSSTSSSSHSLLDNIPYARLRVDYEESVRSVEMAKRAKEDGLASSRKAVQQIDIAAQREGTEHQGRMEVEGAAPAAAESERNTDATTAAAAVSPVGEKEEIGKRIISVSDSLIDDIVGKTPKFPVKRVRFAREVFQARRPVPRVPLSMRVGLGRMSTTPLDSSEAPTDASAPMPLTPAGTASYPKTRIRVESIHDLYFDGEYDLYMDFELSVGRGEPGLVKEKVKIPAGMKCVSLGWEFAL